MEKGKRAGERCAPRVLRGAAEGAVGGQPGEKEAQRWAYHSLELPERRLQPCGPM